METAIETFRRRLSNEWLPAFCAGRENKAYDPSCYVGASADALTEFDARWFLAAVDHKVVTPTTHYFKADCSKTHMQIFWETAAPNRRFTLWYDPVLVIGAFGRLHSDFGWPRAQLGSIKGEYSLEIAFDPTRHAAVALEAKKSADELAAHLAAMAHFASAPTAPEPKPGPQRTAFRKAGLIRRTWPALLWGIAPGGVGQILRVDRHGGTGRFSLTPVSDSALAYEGD